jgi:uncharacterized protein YxeA
MKKRFTLFIAVAFALSLAAVAVAQEKAGASAPANKKGAETKAKTITGAIEVLDAAAGTFSVKGKRDTISLVAGKNVKLDAFKKGDKVTVIYTGDTASKVVAAKKAPKKEAGPHETSREYWEKGRNEGPRKGPGPE